jgi:crotonobetainyl-CoA:carnitine CoA-transferase CaiB-like acyl-CoA transferase
MRPLDGVTIVDFSRVLAGPMATQILAELGARVIKVERPGTGDESRQWEPRVGEDSAYFFAFNRGKESLALDLKTEEGRKTARALALTADVLLENFLPGQMDKLGLGYAELSQAKPDLIYVSNTGFGQTGPYRDRNGYDTIFQALSGVMALTGHPDGPPAKVGVPMADLTAGLWIAIAILTGLVGRANTGKGCHVDLAMLDTQISLLAIAAARVFALGEDPQRTGTEHLGRVPSAAFACAGGEWLHISGSDQHWPAIREVLRLDDLGADPTLAKNSERVRQRERVMEAMRTALAKRERKEVADALRKQGVPAGEVNSVAQALTDPHVVARGMVDRFEHPRAGAFPALRNPLRFTGYDGPYTGVPPLLGADTQAIESELGIKASDP